MELLVAGLAPDVDPEVDSDFAALFSPPDVLPDFSPDDFSPDPPLSEEAAGTVADEPDRLSVR